MTDTNGTMIQYFHWYTPNDGSLWNELKDHSQELAEAGFTAIWIPPCYKGSGGIYDTGYGTYDLFDLGEFDQKNNVRTKYGTRAELLAAIKTAKAAGLAVYADTVFNHKQGGDEEEEVEAVPVNFNNRNQGIGDVEKIKVWTHFKFPGRGEKYSSMKWHWWHFDSINHNMYKPNENTIYRFKDKQFDTAVDRAYGNYDFLMACDLDMNNEEVCQELKNWGEWFLDTTGADGFRLDAVKHIDANFFNNWLDHVRQYAKKNLFAVGEYWSQDVNALHGFISETGGKLSLFDVPLHYNFYSASRTQGHYNMENILQGTLMTEQPNLSVTFVENHDSQPLQALESYVEPWFKPLAYAIILLRREGYPCVFYGDYYGAHYVDKGTDGNEYEIWLPSHRVLIDKFLFARQNFAYGEQYDYLDHFNTIGWTRLGDEEHPKAMAVLMSDGPEGSKMMEVKKPNATFIDITENRKEPIQTNESGWGNFLCNGGSVSVWVEQ